MASVGDMPRMFGSRYRLRALVGQGPSARVYAADDLTLRRRVAVKIMHDEIGRDPRFRASFEQQMRAVASLNLPRLLHVHDWDLSPEPYVVTEYLTGGSLAALLDSGYQLTPSQALAVGLEVARALVNLHARGLAYSGLRPSSILFDADGRLFVVDLGLTPAVGAARADRHQSEHPDDPHQSEHPDNRDRRQPAGIEESQTGDVLALAVMLNEAVTGTRLDPDDLPGDLHLSIALGPLQSVLERTLSGDPDERRSSVGLAEELLRVASLLPRPDPLPLGVAVGEATQAPSPNGAAYPPISSVAAAPTDDDDGLAVSPRAAVPLDEVLRRRWPGILLAAVLVVGGAAAGVWAWLENRPQSAAVPDLVGQTVDDASAAVAELGWEVAEILVREPDSEPGQVMRTDPAAGTELTEGAVITAFVSLGEPLIRVAELAFVYGLSADEATDELADIGLVVSGEMPVNDDVVPSGLVIGVHVDEGVYELEVGADVQLLVSEGPAAAP